MRKKNREEEVSYKKREKEKRTINTLKLEDFLYYRYICSDFCVVCTVDVGVS